MPKKTNKKAILDQTLSELHGHTLLSMTNIEMMYSNIQSSLEQDQRMTLGFVRQLGRNAECLLRLCAQYEGIILLDNAQNGGDK